MTTAEPTLTLTDLVLAAQPAVFASGCDARYELGDAEPEWRFVLDSAFDLSGVTGHLRVLSAIGGDILHESRPRVFREQRKWWQWRRPRVVVGFTVTVAHLPPGEYPWAMTLSDGTQRAQVWGPSNSTLTVIEPAG